MDNRNALKTAFKATDYPMRDVVQVLDFLGYDEIYLDGQWHPLPDVDGKLGTTDDTHVLIVDERPRIRLQDPETGYEIGRARKTSYDELDAVFTWQP